VWVLEVDPASAGWLAATGDSWGAARRLTFPTLGAAIAYAERHGLDYRIVTPPRHTALRINRDASMRLPRSWLARLKRNGRNGEVYHG
jgi:hypothetical protein